MLHLGAAAAGYPCSSPGTCPPATLPLLQRAQRAHPLLPCPRPPDPDELFHPGGPAHSLTAILAAVPPWQPAVRFMNFEGMAEAGDLTNRYEQVSVPGGERDGKRTVGLVGAKPDPET